MAIKEFTLTMVSMVQCYISGDAQNTRIAQIGHKLPKALALSTMDTIRPDNPCNLRPPNYTRQKNFTVVEVS